MCDLHEDLLWSLPVDVRTPEKARALVRAAATNTHTDPAQIETAVLLTSELIANVVRHTLTDVLSLEVHCDGQSVTVTVADTDFAPLRPANPQPLDEGGRGLLIMRAMAKEWGSSYGPEGKRVWFTTLAGDA